MSFGISYQKGFHWSALAKINIKFRHVPWQFRVHFDSKLYEDSSMCKIWTIAAALLAALESVYGVDKQCKLESLLHSASLWVRSSSSWNQSEWHPGPGLCQLNAVNTAAGKSKS